MLAKTDSKKSQLSISWRSVSSVELKAPPLLMCVSSSRELSFFTIAGLWPALAWWTWALSPEPQFPTQAEIHIRSIPKILSGAWYAEVDFQSSIYDKINFLQECIVGALSVCYIVVIFLAHQYRCIVSDGKHQTV